MSKAVSSGQLTYISASAISTFLECKRKWFASYVLGLRSPPSPAMESGTRMHAQMEDWVEGGSSPTDPSCIIATGCVGRLEDHVYVETSLESPTLYLADVPVKGFIDYYDERDPKHPLIIDYKSRGDLRYCKTEEELERDIQGLIYMNWALARCPEADAVTFRHLNLLRVKEGQGGKVKPVSVTLTREDVRTRIADIVRIVEDIKSVAKEAELARVDPTWSACHKNYRQPCHVLTKCQTTQTVADAFVGIPEGEATMGLKDRLEKMKAAQGAPALATGINPPDAAKPAPVQPYVPEVPVESAPEPERVQPAPGLHRPIEPGADLILLIDTVPVKGESGVLDLGALVVEQASTIAARRGVQDVRLVKYGEGTAELVAYFESAPPTGTFTATNTGLTALVLEVLVPRASKVYRALK